MEVNICVPTLKRYDLLLNLIKSAELSTIRPHHYYIIDNGVGLSEEDLQGLNAKGEIVLLKPKYNLGVASSWNWFLENVEEYIIIANDDVEFFEDTIEVLLESYDEKYISYPAGAPSSNLFSCFLVPKNIPDTIGLFDPNISPFYAYFEDNDYHYRMQQVGFDLKAIPECRLKHLGSGTTRRFNKQEMALHHKKFRRARAYYIQKWGGMPGEETYLTPFNK